jgi:uncharacterized protein YjdB
VLNRFRIFVLCAAGCAVFFAGCGQNTQVGTIQISPTTQTLNAGQSAQFSATGIIPHGQHPSTTTDVTSLVTWSSNATAIATVNASGLATAVSAGTAIITATMPGIPAASATVTVTGGTPGKSSTNIVSIAVIPGSQSVASPKQSAQFIAIGTNAAGATLDLTRQVAWNSSSSAIATVGTTGLATGVSQGTATITALFTNSSDQSVVTGSATFQIIGGTTEQVTALTIYPSAQATTSLTQQTQFFVIGTQGSSGLQFDVTSQVAWSSSDTSVVTIGTQGSGTPGLATAVGAGTSTITATYTNSDSSKVVATASFSATLGQSQEPLLSINVVPGDATVSNKGMTTQFLAFGNYSTTPTVRDITNQVTWMTTNIEVGSIGNGGVAGESAGLATSMGYTGNTVIYALDTKTNPDGTVVLSNPVTFTCSDPKLQICIQTVPHPQFATLTVFIQGENTTPGYVTAPSDTGIANLIHCGPGWAGSGGQVCTGTYEVGSTIVLTESFPAGSPSFGGWSSGDGTPGVQCQEANLLTSTTCTVTMTGDASIGAIFY